MDKKEYSLKQTEVVLLSSIQQQANVIFSQAVSYILVDRLAYAITENSRFTVSGDKITVWEETPETNEELKQDSAIADAIGGDK